MINDLIIAADERFTAELNQIFALFVILHDLFALFGLENVCKEFEACQMVVLDDSCFFIFKVLG